MKLFAFALIAATVSSESNARDGDPEAMAFCQGKPDGYHANPRDCGSYFFCWNKGLLNISQYIAANTFVITLMWRCQYCSLETSE